MNEKNTSKAWLITTIIIIALVVIVIIPTMFRAMSLIESEETEISETETIETETKEIETNATSTKETVTNTTKTNTTNKSKITVLICATVVVVVGMICSIALISSCLKHHKKEKDCSDKMLDLFREIYGYPEPKKYKATVQDQNGKTIYSIELEKIK